jgi:hypothetical protein
MMPRPWLGLLHTCLCHLKDHSFDFALRVANVKIALRQARSRQEAQASWPCLQVDDAHFYVERVHHHLAALGVLPDDDLLVGAPCNHVAGMLPHERRKFDCCDGAAVARKGLAQARRVFRVENVPELDVPI